MAPRDGFAGLTSIVLICGDPKNFRRPTSVLVNPTQEVVYPTRDQMLQCLTQEEASFLVEALSRALAEMRRPAPRKILFGEDKVRVGQEEVESHPLGPSNAVSNAVEACLRIWEQTFGVRDPQVGSIEGGPDD